MKCISFLFAYILNISPFKQTTVKHNQKISLPFKELPLFFIVGVIIDLKWEFKTQIYISHFIPIKTYKFFHLETPNYHPNPQDSDRNDRIWDWIEHPE